MNNGNTLKFVHLLYGLKWFFEQILNIIYCKGDSFTVWYKRRINGELKMGIAQYTTYQ